MHQNRRQFLQAGVAALTGAHLSGVDYVRRAAPVRSQANPLDSLSSATAWINSAPLRASALRGKVVLIDVWTYTCINWMRTVPYVRAWASKYKSRGLVVIGVHAPEFTFEHDIDNVRRAVTARRLEHPIAVDNTFSIWRALENRYWPARYLMDGRGRIIHRKFGEGEYDESERAIQQALTDAGSSEVERSLVSNKGEGMEAAADWESLKSPENFLGYERTANFASPGSVARDTGRNYAAPPHLDRNEWALDGNWTVTGEALTLNEPNGKIVCAFHARDLHLVMGPAPRQAAVRFRVLLDGRPPGSAHGIDVDEAGNGVATEQRLYHLIRQAKPIVDRSFMIEFLSEGIQAFSFTFG